ncbi:MAG TPA: PQQ-binding-like beta-propeller repeat protein [Gemmataceae bacterium]|nr:PQQ-binding-like beta-propeller repeat protein [Gemmataceae bacterium]
MTARFLAATALGLATLAVSSAGDWPQWRGPNRDGRATGFKAPAAWPKELTKKWSVKVGDGVATPSLVGDKLFVFAREGDSATGSEVTRCLDAATGNEVWAERYVAAFKPSADRGFPGPRSSPTVIDGKVVTLGVNGTLSCLDAKSGKKEWRVETKGFPNFHTSSSPVVADGLVVAQFGGEKGGGVAAYNLTDGNEKWKWTDEGTGYASPVLMTVGGTKMVVVETSASVIGLGLADGKLLWKTPFEVTGRGYNASTPMADGETVYFSGTARGTRAVKVEKAGETFAAKEVWHNKDNSVIYNTPVVRGKSVFGLTSNNALFRIDRESGKTAWTAETKGKGGYGSIVDAGPALVLLTPVGQLVVYEPSDTEFKQVASYKVAGTETYAHPVLDGNRVFVKDKDSVTLWTVE